MVLGRVTAATWKHEDEHPNICVVADSTTWSSARFRRELSQHWDLLITANKDVNKGNENLIACGGPQLALKLPFLNSAA